MSYYVDKDGLRCDGCFAALNERNHHEIRHKDLCAWCYQEYRQDRRSFYLTWLMVLTIIGGALWVLYSLPPTFD